MKRTHTVSTTVSASFPLPYTVSHDEFKDYVSFYFGEGSAVRLGLEIMFITLAVAG